MRWCPSVSDGASCASCPCTGALSRFIFRLTLRTSFVGKCPQTVSRWNVRIHRVTSVRAAMCVEWMLSTELMVEKVRSMIALLPLTRRNNNAISLNSGQTCTTDSQYCTGCTGPAGAAFLMVREQRVSQEGLVLRDAGRRRKVDLLTRNFNRRP